MKTKKLNLDSFKALQLTNTECKHIICGAPDPNDGPTPTPVVRPAGGIDEGDKICYYDYFGELIYCINKDGDQIFGS